MPQAVNELDVDFDAQIQEIRRLISTTTDPDRRIILEDQLKDLELASLQSSHDQARVNEIPLKERRKSFRPTSAKPRMMLTPLVEDTEMQSTSTSFSGLDAYRIDNGGLPLVSEIFSSSYDESFLPQNVLTNDHYTYWMSTGMYPQFLKLILREPMRIGVVEITCRHVKTMSVHAARNKAITRDMEVAVEVDVSSSESGKLSTRRFAFGKTGRSGVNSNSEDGNDGVKVAEVIEIVIESGDSDFAVVYFVRLRQITEKEVT